MTGRPEQGSEPEPESSDAGPPPLPQHVAVDRFGRTALSAAHRLGQDLADDPDDVEPVVHHRGGPHRSIDGLAALIDEALADDERPSGADRRSSP